MPVEGPDPNAPRAGGAPETSGGGRAESVELDATLEQLAPPAWALSGQLGVVQRVAVGQEVHEQSAEIEPAVGPVDR